MKTATIAIIGRPSSGKSTLMNSLCNKKVSIISTIPQTTRNRIKGIYNSENCQYIFIDTPGFHNSEKKFNIYLKNLVLSSIQDIDIILYVIDISRPIGEEEKFLTEIIKGLKGKFIVICNKVDIKNKYSEDVLNFVESNFKEHHFYNISALKNTGKNKLLKAIYKIAPTGERLYPEDIYTDQDPEFRVSEILREKAINLTKQEIPHHLYVEIADMEIQKQEKSLWIRAFIYVERESQKGILVGKRGEKIKKIKNDSLKEIRQIFPYYIKLDLRVKVKPKWRNNDQLLKKLIY